MQEEPNRQNEEKKEIDEEREGHIQRGKKVER